MRRVHWLWLAVFVVAVVYSALFAVYVWPTRYRYETVSIGANQPSIVRIDRQTGSAQILIVGQWVQVKEAERPQPVTASTERFDLEAIDRIMAEQALAKK